MGPGPVMTRARVRADGMAWLKHPESPHWPLSAAESPANPLGAVTGARTALGAAEGPIQGWAAEDVLARLSRLRGTAFADAVTALGHAQPSALVLVVAWAVVRWEREHFMDLGGNL